MEITVGSLFSGIGGLDLGLERAGMKVIWQSEIDKYCCKVLKKHWPEVPNHGDIKEINWKEIEKPNVIAGGYPCQPFSYAGKRQGTQDPRHLWPWVRKAISELRPDYAILENVPGHLTMGGTEVIGTLAEIGYDAEWRVVLAAGLGANHMRKRIIIVAYPNSGGSKIPIEGQQSGQQMSGSDGQNGQIDKMANSKSKSCDEFIDGEFEESTSHDCFPKRRKKIDVFQTGGANGFDNAGHWLIEPNVGRVAHGIPNRVDRLRGLGNAVVPQVAEYIGRLVVEHYNSK